MEGTTASLNDSGSLQEQTIFQLQKIAFRMSAWLKFLGIISMISGAFIALSIIGILYAWLPIWLGILLFQAGDSAHISQVSGSLNEMVKMLDKLKIYFIISGVVTIISYAILGILILVFMNLFQQIPLGEEFIEYLY